jgi:hypothetical protein
MTLKTRLAPIAFAALLAVPATPADAVVPPGNSAVNQYTETFPTARGAQTTKGKKARSPRQVLGRDQAGKLAAQGPTGREVAEIVAATAPSDISANRPQARHGKAAPTDKAAPTGEGPGGSSGLHEVIAQATGSSDSGRMGALLPLLIAAAVAGSAFYLWRHRRQAA